jgi:hypothetical protein
MKIDITTLFVLMIFVNYSQKIHELLPWNISLDDS